MFDFDPSSLDPKTLMEISKIMQQLPPEQINRMQTLMHNMMAGFDVRGEMAEFEKNLPPGFREKLMVAMAGAQAAVRTQAPGAETPAPIELAAEGMDVREARLTILRGVSERQITPEEALQLLFPSHKN